MDLKGEKVAQLPARDVTLMSMFDVFVGSTIDWLCLADTHSLLSFGIFHFINTFPRRSLPAQPGDFGYFSVTVFFFQLQMEAFDYLQELYCTQ